jgi:isoleucyl-tRNA synthetase
MFEINDGESFGQREERILRFWQEEKIFLQSVAKKGPLFTFYDGPPFATGLPHYGHILAGTIKDVIPRYKTMKGYTVPRRFGWDCHGLPVENEIEKAQELSGASSIEQFGVAKFNEECRSIVLRYTEEWERRVERMGRWVDFRKTYKTMDKSYMESVWWVFAELYNKGLIYEGFKVMPFSAKLGTPLSNFEANLNYRDVDDPSIMVAFTLEDDPQVALVAWTTTPWTLPSNLALCVHPELDYVKIETAGRLLIVAEARLKSTFPEAKVVAQFKGKTLKNKKYLPLFPYFQKEEAFRVVIDEFVSIEEGTGVVHMAPAFGEADFFICEREGIDPVCPVDQNGKFTAEVPDYAGLFVKDADKEIIRRLKSERKLIHHTQIHHRYPFCWRSDTPLIYKAVRTWFVAVEKIKDKLLEANQEVRWVPGHLKEGRFGKWLENARDWAISRNRYWGTPIPLWRSDDGEICVIGSVRELEEKTGKEILDLHRHFIDDVTFVQNGKTFKRIHEVFDCWFESGSMPYAQNHYPFDQKTLDTFPADFIGEGLDQTRGWFYTLHVLAVALFDQPAFKNVIVNGIVLAEDGTKMSKRLKNYPEPGLLIDQFGADALRLYLLSSQAVMADDLRFSAKGVELILRQALIPLWNAYLFFATYAKIYSYKPHFQVPKADIDRWILSLSQKLVSDVEEKLEAYELQAATLPIMSFIDQLTDWYIRRCRSRFWSEEESQDRADAFSTLYTVLMTVVKTAAPFIPFLADAIYLELRQKEDPVSVHLAAFPTVQSKLQDGDLEKEMQAVQTVVSVGHALRKEHKLKVRQPLSQAHVVCSNPQKLLYFEKHKALIAEELNVHEVLFHQDEKEFVSLHGKPNFRILGKKVGKLMNSVQKRVSHLTLLELTTLLNGGSLSIEVEGEMIELTSDDIAVERKVKEGAVAATVTDVTVALDTALTPALIEEGLARELVNKINTMRREKEFAVTDRIHLKLQSSAEVKAAFEQHRDYICHEVLALSFSFEPCQGEALDINGHATAIELRKATS